LHPNSSRRFGAALLVGGALVLASSMWFYVSLILVPYQVNDAARSGRPRGNLSDLYPRWLGSRELLLHGRSPYSPEVTAEIQEGYYGRRLNPNLPSDPKDEQAFAYPVYVALLLAPTVHYPFAVVKVGFQCVLVVFTAASVLLWLLVIRWRPHPPTVATLIILTLGSFPAVQGFKLQQLSLLGAALIALSMALLVACQPFASGIVLAVATIKPQLVLPLLICLLVWVAGDWSRRQRFFWGFASMMVVLLGAAELLLPGWVRKFATAMSDYTHYTGGQSLLDVLLSRRMGGMIAALSLLLLITVAWRVRRAHAESPEFSLLVAGALTVTLMVIPMFAPYNQVLLLPGILWIVRRWRDLRLKNAWSKLGYWLSVAALGWPWFACLSLSIASVVLPAAVLQRGWAIPLYTSLAIPLVLSIPLVILLAETFDSGSLRDPTPLH
jgi:hypothetical protein